MKQQSTGRENNFWQKSSSIPLARNKLGAGVFRIDLTTTQPVYADLRLAFESDARPPLRQSFDMLAPTRYSALLRLDGACSDARVITTPPTGSEEIADLVVRKLGPASQAALGARKILGNLRSPKHLLLKLRQVISGPGNLKMKSIGGSRLDANEAYYLWQQIFESGSERERLRIALEAKRVTRALSALVVFSTVSDAFITLRNFLETFATDSKKTGGSRCKLHLLVIETDEAPLPENLRKRVEDFGGEVVGDTTGKISLPVVESAIRRHSATFFTFLDRSGRFPDWAFDALALEFLRRPDALMIYADSDLLTPAGKRVDPSFKPGWSPEYLLAWNYIRAPIAYSPAVLKQSNLRELPRPKAASFALALSVISGEQQSSVHRIPRILFHEIIQESDRMGSDVTFRKECETVQEWLAEPGRAGSLSQGDMSLRARIRRVEHRQPRPSPRVSVIILTKDHPELLNDATRTVLETDYPDFEIIIIDNGSQKVAQRDLLAALAGKPNVMVESDDRPFNFSALNNQARHKCTGDVLVFLNDDTKALKPDWLYELSTLATLPDVGCVGALLLYADGSIQHAGVTLGIGGLAGHSFRHADPDDPDLEMYLQVRREVSAVTGACLAIRTSVFDEVGGFNEALPVAFNDVDLCLRVREKQYRNLFTPHAVLEHYESATRGMDVSPQRLERLEHETVMFLRKWESCTLDDQYYNPHLSRTSEDFCPRFKG